MRPTYTRRSHFVGFAVVVDTCELFQGDVVLQLLCNVSRKKHTGDLGASALSGTPNNSAELRYLVGLFELRISFPCAPAFARDLITARVFTKCLHSRCSPSGSAPDVFAQEVAQLGFVHLHGEP